jgi:hypothetical protein
MLDGRRIALAHIAAHSLTLLFFLVYFWVLVITAVDNALFYAVFPYRYVVAVALTLLLLLVPGRGWQFKLGLLLILAVWFSLLPRVSWHADSNFFINAGSLRKGMTLEQATGRMRPFVMTASADGKEVWFQPRPDSQEACVLALRGGKVRNITLRHH